MGRKTVPRTCQHCGVDFLAWVDSKGIFCSRKCTAQATVRRAPLVLHVCKFCGNEFIFRKGKSAGLFCSPPCKQKGQRIEIAPGTRFNHLVVIGYGPRFIECLCDCGKVATYSSSQLRDGHVVSCGCVRIAQRIKHGLWLTPENQVWAGMKQRCLNPKQPEYKNYGGRGIAVCAEWIDSYPTFYADMGPRPTPKHSIERVDNSKGYSPDNCVWATQTQQRRNTRQNRYVTFQGITHCITEWSQLLGISLSTLRYRLSRWSTERAFTAPVKSP